MNRLFEKAQSTVEFALLVPVLMLLIIGIMQAGILWGKQLDLKSATADSARRAAVSMHAEDPVLITEQAFMQAVSLVSEDDFEISVTPAPPWDHGDYITVRTSTPHTFSIFGVVGFDGTLRAESVIRVE